MTVYNIVGYRFTVLLLTKLDLHASQDHRRYLPVLAELRLCCTNFPIVEKLPIINPTLKIQDFYLGLNTDH